MNMSKFIIITCFVALVTSSCISGHKDQNWHPRTAKKMQKGHNNK